MKAAFVAFVFLSALSPVLADGLKLGKPAAPKPAGRIRTALGKMRGLWSGNPSRQTKAQKPAGHWADWALAFKDVQPW